MENSVENMDTTELIDSNIINATKKIRCLSKKRPDENTIVDYLCKSYPDSNGNHPSKDYLLGKQK